MDEKTERTLEQLQQDFEEAKVARDFTYTPEGRTFLEVLKRTATHFNSYRLHPKVFVNPFSEMCLDAQYQGVARGIEMVVAMLEGSTEEVRRLQKEIETVEEKTSFKQVGLINKFDVSKIR